MTYVYIKLIDVIKFLSILYLVIDMVSSRLNKLNWIFILAQGPSLYVRI